MENVRQATYAPNGISLAQLSLSNPKVLHKENRLPFVLRLGNTLRLSIQCHDAVVAAPDASSPLPTLVINPEWATKLLHTAPALLQPLDGRCSWQGRYNVFATGELGSLIE